MKIVFIHLGIQFNGDALEQRALGGTETALIGMSKALAKNPANQVQHLGMLEGKIELTAVGMFPKNFAPLPLAQSRTAPCTKSSWRSSCAKLKFLPTPTPLKKPFAFRY